MRMASSMAMAAGFLIAAAPALADVKAGVDAWAAGNYDAAVKEWVGPSAQGDPDAQFNLAQAYRLGRGVPRNDAKAKELYSKAAAQGHLQAADNYGMMLFQAGQREEAMPYVQAASDRGDPRAQYLLGIAHFNGDVVAKDWVRAYALMTLANSSGLPQAQPAMAEMDKFIPMEDRQKGVALSSKLREQADAKLAQQLAAVDLGVTTPAAKPVPATSSVPSKVAASPKVPSAIPTTPVAPSVAAAEAAVAEAIRVTGTESPATAGADFARPGGASAQAASAQPSTPKPVPVPQSTAKPAPAVAKAESPAKPASAPAPATSGGSWRVQLGSFSVPGNADKMWSQLGGKGPLAGKEKIVGQSGKLTVLSAGGFASREAAASACSTLKQSGQTCLVAR